MIWSRPSMWRRNLGTFGTSGRWMKNCLTAHPRKPTQSSASMKSLHVWHAAHPPVETHGSSFGSGVSKSGHSYDHFTSSDEQKSQIVTRLGKMSLGITFPFGRFHPASPRDAHTWQRSLWPRACSRTTRTTASGQRDSG